MAANEVVRCFASMTEPELRQWVEANPGRVNDRDRFGHTPFNAAVYRRKSVPLILWLVKEKGADVNAEIANSCYRLACAETVDIVNALLDCGTDPNLMPSFCPATALTWHVGRRNVEVVARLLQDPRVRDTINIQPWGGKTALYTACMVVAKPDAADVI